MIKVSFPESIHPSSITSLVSQTPSITSNNSTSSSIAQKCSSYTSKLKCCLKKHASGLLLKARFRHSSLAWNGSKSSRVTLQGDMDAAQRRKLFRPITCVQRLCTSQDLTPHAIAALQEFTGYRATAVLPACAPFFWRTRAIRVVVGNILA
ncbi:hypothetical protein BC827DRAFT_870343 [Russula dissimulans]|nr:hypothetical protein BC827DRAFT_870343 [Russula dissimulans]